MSGLFGPKKGTKKKTQIYSQIINPSKLICFFQDPVKETNKVLRGAQRDIDRDRNQLDREKKKLELEIKKMAKEGNKQVDH